jgi:hypothetical protein
VSIFKESINRKIFFYSAYIFSENNEKYFSFAIQPIDKIGPGMKNIFHPHGRQNDDTSIPAMSQQEKASPASTISTHRTIRRETP